MKRRTVCSALVLGFVVAAFPPNGLCASTTQPAEGWPDAPADARMTPEGWFAPRPPVEKPALAETVTRAYVIPIHGPITATLQKVVERKVEHCKQADAQIVIFDMNTPGGRSDVMAAVARMIMDDLSDVYTVAYVNPEAYSAGATISLACNEIVMSPTGVIGDAMPIMLGPQGLVEIPEKERGKFESAARAAVRVLAAQNGYDPLLCEAMITLTMELWLIRNAGGELKIVDAVEWGGRISDVPPARKIKGMTYPAQAEWRWVRTIDGPDMLVTLTASQAQFVGLVENIFEDMDALTAHYRIETDPIVLADTRAEKLAAFLSSPLVTSVLVTAAIFFLYIEIRTPGFGIAGGLGILCFAILIAGRYTTGLANYWEVALFMLGAAMIAVEIVAIPGFGVVGISGILCCTVSLVAMLIQNAPDEFPWPRTTPDWDVFTSGLMALGLGVIGAAIAGALASKYLPKFPVIRGLILPSAPQGVEASIAAGSPLKHIATGDTGVVESTCHPVGRVRFGEELLDAQSEGDIIQAGQAVRVLRRQGNKIIVERS